MHAIRMDVTETIIKTQCLNAFLKVLRNSFERRYFMRLCYLSLIFFVGLASGCVTVNGNYRVSAIDANGAELVKGISAQGRAIYSVRNAICSQHSNATVIITDMQTGKALSGESPYKCR
ncbi:hypothetical protein [Pseudomonas aeruginosa]|uniref:hypothetical protein n=1 Tax=Pseudomonas aeruginosa TaxID=287 RepID=UPI001E369861|nr:hypothetical protein [Pseudomonas aeruginosa]